MNVHWPSRFGTGGYRGHRDAYAPARTEDNTTMVKFAQTWEDRESTQDVATKPQAKVSVGKENYENQH